MAHRNNTPKNKFLLVKTDKIQTFNKIFKQIESPRNQDLKLFLQQVLLLVKTTTPIVILLFRQLKQLQHLQVLPNKAICQLNNYKLYSCSNISNNNNCWFKMLLLLNNTNNLYLLQTLHLTRLKTIAIILLKCPMLLTWTSSNSTTIWWIPTIMREELLRLYSHLIVQIIQIIIKLFLLKKLRLGQIILSSKIIWKLKVKWASSILLKVDQVATMQVATAQL